MSDDEFLANVTGLPVVVGLGVHGLHVRAVGPDFTITLAPKPRPVWSKRSNEGRDYLSVKLDDPSFNAPIYANLFDDEDGEGFTLIWSRGRKPNGD